MLPDALNEGSFEEMSPVLRRAGLLSILCLSALQYIYADALLKIYSLKEVIVFVLGARGG